MLTPENRNPEEMTKKERAAEVLGNLMDMMPPMLRSMAPLFLTQFRGQFDSLEDSDIDEILTLFRSKLDYIEFGEV